MKCAEIRENLAAYLDGEIGGAPRRAMDDHFAACEACSGERRAQAAAWRLLEVAAPPAAPAGQRDRILARARTSGGGGGRVLPFRLPAAAAAAAVLLAAGGAFLLLKDRPVSDGIGAGDAPPDQLLDDLPVLEAMDVLEYADVLDRFESGPAEDLYVLDGG
jgi:hypothetical protein